MNLFKALFGGKTETTTEHNENELKKNFDVLKYDGVRAMKAGKFAYAIECFTHALDITPDLQTMDYLSRAYASLGKYQDAFNTLKTMSEAVPDNQHILMSMASMAYCMDNYGLMGETCERALQLGQDNASVFYLYAEAMKGQGDTVNAISMLTKALELIPDYIEALLLRAKLLMETGDNAGASADVDHILKKNPNNEDALLLKAQIAVKQNNAQAALEYFGKVLDVNPFNIDVFKDRAALYRAEGNEQKAEEDEREVAELEKNISVADGNIEEQTRQAYNKINPFGI